MRTLREGAQREPSGRGLSENPQGGDSVRSLREGLSENPRGGDSVRTLREGLSENPQGGDSVRTQGT